MRDEELSLVAGIGGCTFCHVREFIGSNEGYEGVLEMARVVLWDGREMRPWIRFLAGVVGTGAFVPPSPPQLTSATQHSWHLVL